MDVVPGHLPFLFYNKSLLSLYAFFFRFEIFIFYVVTVFGVPFLICPPINLPLDYLTFNKFGVLS